MLKNNQNGSKPKRVATSLKMLGSTVVAKTRRLNAMWTIESVDDWLGSFSIAKPVKKVTRAYMFAARLRPYSGSNRGGAAVGIGRGRHWRINCLNEFQISDKYADFDRWANSVAATRTITDQFDSVEAFLTMIKDMEAEAKTQL